MAKKLVGIDKIGNLVREADLLGHCYVGELIEFYSNIIFAIAEGKKALGEKIELRPDTILNVLPPIKAKPGNRRFDAVIVGSRLLRNVRVVQRRRLDDMVMPRLAQKVFGQWTWSTPIDEFLSLENDKGDYVYVWAAITTTYTHAKRFIVK